MANAVNTLIESAVWSSNFSTDIASSTSDILRGLQEQVKSTSASTQVILPFLEKNPVCIVNHRRIFSFTLGAILYTPVLILVGAASVLVPNSL